MKKCRVCGVELNSGNTYACIMRTGSRICKKCQREYVRAWGKSNPERKRKYLRKWYSRNPNYMRNYMREYMRTNYISHIRVPKKRQRPESCEVCGRQPKRLAYHHWDDEHPEVGIWVCIFCHIIAETIDSAVLENRVTKYNALKLERKAF